MLRFVAGSGLLVIMLAGMLALIPFALATSYAAKISYAAKRAGGTEKPSYAKISTKPAIRTASLTAGDAPVEKTNLVVLGDSLGDGVWAGLYRAFRKNKNIKVLRRSKPSTGFVRVDYYDWNANLVQILNKTRIDIAVVMVGANDRQTISTKAGRYRPGSKRWREIYASRVDSFIKKLKAHGAKIYWVGMPITRRKKLTRHMKMLNEIFAERARANNITFVDIWKDFTTASGRYSANGRDITGRMRKLRANDGVHFTMRGYRKLALAAERYIRADFNASPSPVAVMKLVEKPMEAEGKKPLSSFKPVNRVSPVRSEITRPERPVSVISVVSGADMAVQEKTLKQGPEVQAVTPAAEFTPAPRFVSIDSGDEKVESLKIALNTMAGYFVRQPVKARQQAWVSLRKPDKLPKFQPDAEYLAKNLQKNQKNDLGRVIRQALANDFQDILSIVQPDKAVAVTSRAAIVPNQEAQLNQSMVLPQRQQMRKIVTMSLSSEINGNSGKTRVASRNEEIVRPVSIESGTPDDTVEYASEVEFRNGKSYGRVASAGASSLPAIAPVSGLDSTARSDAKGILAALANRALLRGDALPPKIGRGDDFSWPRD